MYYDRGNHHDFTSLVRELARPGEITQTTSYAFEFLNIEKPYETYAGTNVRLRLVVLCYINRFFRATKIKGFAIYMFVKFSIYGF